MRDEELAKMLQQLPASTQFAIVNCLPNIPYGANWGLCEMSDVRERLDSIKADKNLFALPVKSGVVLQVAEGYLETICNKVQRGFITMKDLQVMRAKKAEAYQAFESFLLKREKKTPYRGYIGIYCTNLVTNIRYENIDYPAFRVDLQTALSLLHKYGYSIQEKTSGEKISAKEFSTLISTQPSRVSASLLMSPTRTGVFIHVGK